MKKTPLRRKTKFKTQSTQGRRRNAKYYRLREPFMKANPVCQICGVRPSTDIHHRKGRRGDLLFDEQWWMALCRPCHSAVHDNPKWAKEHGYLVPFWK